MAGAMDLLRLSSDEGFVLDAHGRMLSESDPDRSPAPRLYLTSCEEGNVVKLRHDVSPPHAERVLKLIESGPPWSDPEADPAQLSEIVAILAEAAPPAVEPGVLHHLPKATQFETPLPILFSSTVEGEALERRLAKHGMPKEMADAGFRTSHDLWPPWCASVDGERVASIAFAARLGARSAAIGVYTFPAFRNCGLATAVTGAWSSHSALDNRALFYGARRNNVSSRRVAARLKLPLLGATLRIV
jgi:hypothetical protein